MDVARRENSVILLENNYKEKYQGFDPNSIDSYIMFEYMQDKYIDRSIQFAADVEEQCTANADRSNRGVRQAGFWVLHQTSMAAVLIELGYITNSCEEAFLTSTDGQNRLAESIFKAFKAFKHDHERRSSAKLTSNNADRPSSTDEDTAQIVKADSIKPTNESSKTRKEKEKEEPVEASLPEKKKSVVTIKSQADNVIKTGAPIFKVQFLLSDQKLPDNSPKFKNLDNVSFYQENNLYKYTSGDTQDFNQIIAKHREIKKLFPTAFIIAFVNNQKVPLQQAIQLWKTNK
jgi:N-acetylmuramoyl-L-alanine amidase